MATKKKTTAKKAASKKPAAKKKAAAKKTTVKKPAAKKATTKTAAKKTTVKKAAAKPAVKTAAKKSTVKAASKKPPITAPKKPAPKNTAKAASKVAIKPAAKRPASAPADNVKLRNLFEAYAQNKLPFAQGYIVSSFFSLSSVYSVYEIVSYAGVKEIYPAADGLTFVSGGKKLHVLVEPDTYHQKHVEPVSRSKTEGEYIPQRYSELEILIAKNQSRIMVAKDPVEITSSFTILEPKGINFSVVFYDHADVMTTLASFFQESLNRQRRIPELDAKKAAKLITDIVSKSMSFKGEFQ